MGTISAKVIRKPRKRWYCANCGTGPMDEHLRLYGYGCSGDPPWVMRLCIPCGDNGADKKIQAALAKERDDE